MIVKNTNAGWEIVTQTGHAFLACQIANKLSTKFKNNYWLETLLAVYNHETLKTDFNSGSILNEKGMPLDFRESYATDAETIDKIENMAKTISYRSSLVSALTIRHLKFLHPELFANKKVDYNSFIRKVCRDFSIKSKEFEQMYGVLQFSDRLSLIICFDELPQTSRKVEINNSLDGNSIFIQNEESKFILDPWPFESDEISIYKELRVMNSAKFKTENSFLKEYHEMEIKKLSFKFYK